MEGNFGKSNDRISDLPVPILHQILTCLPIKDAIRTSVLSKQWNSIQKCFPILEFKLPYYIKSMPIDTPQFKGRNRRFLDFVDRSLQTFIWNNLSFERIGFRVSYFDDDSVPVVNTWLPLALHNGVSDLKFKAKHDYYPLPEATFSVNSALRSGSSEFLHLQKLKLSKVVLSETLVRDIIRNCPNLSDLSLLEIDGLKTLNILKPVKLASLTILDYDSVKWFRSIVVDALSLNFFSLVFYGDYIPGQMIDLTSCSNLTELKLYNSSITEASFNQHMSRLPLLEFLDVSFCSDLRSIKITLPRLKHLKLSHCIALEAIEIGAPMLSKFVYISHGSGDLPVLVLPDVIPGSMYLRYGCFSENALLDNSKFLEFREFLTAPFKGIYFSFRTHDVELHFDPVVLRFDHDDLREAVVPPLVEVDCLDLSKVRLKHSYHWETLLDGLLWSCHPKMIRIKMTPDCSDEENLIKIEENWIKIKALDKMLNERRCRLCCNLPSCKCWRHRLKAVKMERVFPQFNSRSVIKNNVSKPEDDEVRFLFDWDHFA